jgi:Carboxypeptidase regulatory-like domain
MRSVKEKISFLWIVLVFVVSAAHAEVGGKITGVVKDQTGSIIPGAAVVITNASTGFKLTATTDQDGVFTFPVLSVGQYQIDVTADGFRAYRKTGLVIDINSALIVNVTLQVKEQDQAIVVTENAAQVETTDTQLGQVLGSKKVTEIPLNGRSYTDLFATQVGVTPLTTSGAGNSTSGGGFGTVPVAGATNTGQFSINGQREHANGFMLNGASVQEGIGQ